MMLLCEDTSGEVRMFSCSHLRAAASKQIRGSMIYPGSMVK